MATPLATLAWRGALCAAAAWQAWLRFGAESIALTIPLFAVAVAKPLLEVLGDSIRALRAHALADIEGCHYVYRGIPVRVVEGPDRRRWVRAADVRHIASSADSDHALRLVHGEGFALKGKPPEHYFSEDALLSHLSHHGTAPALRLRQWVERTVVWPARERRRRLGMASADSAHRHAR